MRILRFLGMFAVVALLLSLGGFFVAREALMFKATYDIEEAVKQMETVDAAKFRYQQNCVRKAGGNAQIQSVELHFSNDQEYSIVALCEYFSNEPVLIETFSLPRFIKKVPGESGLIWDPDGRSGIQLEIWGLTKTFILDGQELLKMRGDHPVDGNQPAASCGGFGFQCCDQVTEIGSGKSVSAVDCPQHCSSTCQSRPVVLRMYSDPPPDYQTKTLTIRPGTQVTISFIIDPGQSESVETTVDFGDGQRQTVPEVEGVVNHVYQCGREQCEYTATVQAVDEQGQPSIITSIATTNIKVE